MQNIDLTEKKWSIIKQRFIIYLFIYLFMYSFIYLYIYLFNYLFIHLFIYLFIYLLIYLSIYLFVPYLFINLFSIYLLLRNAVMRRSSLEEKYIKKQIDQSVKV